MTVKKTTQKNDAQLINNLLIDLISEIRKSVKFNAKTLSYCFSKIFCEKLSVPKMAKLIADAKHGKKGKIGNVVLSDDFTKEFATFFEEYRLAEFKKTKNFKRNFKFALRYLFDELHALIVKEMNPSFDFSVSLRQVIADATNVSLAYITRINLSEYHSTELCNYKKLYEAIKQPYIDRCFPVIKKINIEYGEKYRPSDIVELYKEIKAKHPTLSTNKLIDYIFESTQLSYGTVKAYVYLYENSKK